MWKAAEKFIQKYAQGEAVFVEGEDGSEMFFVLTGCVHIVRDNGEAQQTLATLKPGEMFGEMALVLGGARFASAVAGEDETQVIAIDQARFVYLVSQQPAFALSVMRVMAQRLAGSKPQPVVQEA